MQALDQKALARRRQRAPTPSSGATGAPGSRDVNNDAASISTAHSDDFFHVRTVQTAHTPPTSRLKQESAQVGEEAASILASVRKSSQKPPPSGSDTHSLRGSYITPTMQSLATEATVRSTAPALSSIPKRPEQPASLKATAPASTQSDGTAPSARAPTNILDESFQSATTAQSQRIKEQLESLSKMESAVRPNNPTAATEASGSLSVPTVTSSTLPTPTPTSALNATRQQSTEPSLPPKSVPKQEDNASRAKATPADSDEKEIMAEDVEPLVQNALIDASCFQIKQSVMLRACSLDKMLQVPLSSAKGASSPPSQIVEASGPGLGGESETWILYVLGDQGNKSPILRYGDTVCLCSSQSKHFLGVKPVEKDNAISFETGCFRATPGKAEQWTVLRSNTGGKPIRVGKAAMDSKATGRRRLTAPVKSGDGIVLRSCQMGGVVAVLSDGQIQLVTDSYDSNTIRHGRPEEATLLGRLQRHSKLVPSERETIHLIHATCPPLPSWALGMTCDGRQYLDGTLSYLCHEERHNLCKEDRQQFTLGDGARHDEVINPTMQEELLISELLGSFLGLEGQFVRIADGESTSDSPIFRLFDTPDVSFDKGVRTMVESMLPLATYFTGIQSFLSSHAAHNFGCVMHALCEKVDSLLQEQLLRITSIDMNDGGRLLGTLQVEIRPTLERMSFLYHATQALRNKTGGALLNTLDGLRLGPFHGNAMAEHLAKELLDFAAAPYMQRMSRWVEFGELDDPYNEFMVRQYDAVAWEDRFAIVGPHVLEHFFPTPPSVEKVLNTGRYWNVVNSSEATKFSPMAMSLRYTSDATDVSAYIERSYAKASEVLLHRLLHEHDLVHSLKVMKRYYLLDQGDFFVNFMDAAEAELLLGVNKLSWGQIEHWFNVSVQMTEHGEELAGRNTCADQRRQLSPSKFRCRFVSESLADALDTLLASTASTDGREPATPQRLSYGDPLTGLTGVDTFVISVTDVPFPACLVLNSTCMSQYQLLFRHLFFAKHVERSIVGIWQDHQAMKELESSSVRSGIGPTFLLRARMLHFIQNLIYYLVVETIDTNWWELHGVVSSAGARNQTIDDILAAHQSFLDKTLEACLLKDRNLLRALTKLLNTCLMFGYQMNRFMESTGINEDKKKMAAAKRRAVRRTLNDRGSARESVSLQRLHETMTEERAERRKRVQAQRIRVKVELNSPSYRSMIAQFSEGFSNDLAVFLGELRKDTSTPRAVNLALRLDFNGMTAAATSESN